MAASLSAYASMDAAAAIAAAQAAPDTGLKVAAESISGAEGGMQTFVDLDAVGVFMDELA